MTGRHRVSSTRHAHGRGTSETALADLRELLASPSDERGITWWEWIRDGLGGDLFAEFSRLLNPATNHVNGIVDGEIEVCLTCPLNSWNEHPAWELAHPSETKE